MDALIEVGSSPTLAGFGTISSTPWTWRGALDRMLWPFSCGSVPHQRRASGTQEALRCLAAPLVLGRGNGMWAGRLCRWEWVCVCLSSSSSFPWPSLLCVRVVCVCVPTARLAFSTPSASSHGRLQAIARQPASQVLCGAWRYQIVLPVSHVASSPTSHRSVSTRRCQTGQTPTPPLLLPRAPPLPSRRFDSCCLFVGRCLSYVSRANLSRLMVCRPHSLAR